MFWHASLLLAGLIARLLCPDLWPAWTTPCLLGLGLGLLWPQTLAFKQ